MNLLNSLTAVGLLAWLADFYLLATLLMLIAVIARRWIRQPEQRLTVGWIVSVELTALAVACVMPFWPRILLRAAAAQKPAVESPKVADDAPLPPATFSRVPRPFPSLDIPANRDVPEAAPPPVAARPPWNWLELAAAAYLASAGLVIVWLVWGAVAASRACRCAENAPESLRQELARIVGDGRRTPRLLVSSRVATAVALGLRHPTVLLPAGLVRDGSPPALRAVLMHEWTHIRNGDLWLLALGRGLLVLLFPHPLFWWLRRAVRGDQELLADAAAAGDNRPAYAEELLRLVRKTAYPSPMAASAAVGIWEGSSQLSRRIAMLLDETIRIEPTAPRRWRYRALGLLVLLGAACSLLTLQPARSAGQTNSPLPAGEGQGVRAVASPRPSGEGQGVRAFDSESASPKQNLYSGSRIITGGALLTDAPTTSTGSVIITTGSTGPDADDGIVLPSQRLFLLKQRSVLEELKLTAERRKGLQAVRHQHFTAESKFFAETLKGKKLPQDKGLIAYPQWERKQNKKIEQQVAEILTPEQMRLLNDLTLQDKAYLRVTVSQMAENSASTTSSAGHTMRCGKKCTARFRSRFRRRSTRSSIS